MRQKGRIAVLGRSGGAWLLQETFYIACYLLYLSLEPERG